jgi:hypothetical protein
MGRKRRPSPLPKPPTSKYYIAWRNQFLTQAVVAADQAVPWTGNDVAKAEWNSVYHGAMRRLAGA